MLRSKMIRLVSSTVWPKHVLRLWWDPHGRVSGLVGRGRSCLEYDNKECHVDSLLEGSFSCGTQRPDGGLKKVPKGFLAVYVGPDDRRFVIPTSYLSMPEFRRLMDTMAEEFGFEQEGGLRIPCDEQDFVEVLVKCFQLHKTMSKIKKMGRARLEGNKP